MIPAPRKFRIGLFGILFAVSFLMTGIMLLALLKDRSNVARTFFLLIFPFATLPSFFPLAKDTAAIPLMLIQLIIYSIVISINWVNRRKVLLGLGIVHISCATFVMFYDRFAWLFRR
jgi:hypothetical protein